MKKIESCPICKYNILKILKIYNFEDPGNNVKNNLGSSSYTRRWILFKKILKERNSAKFYSVMCNSCGFIFINPRLNDEELKIKYDTIIELGSVKYRMRNRRLMKVDRRSKRIYRLIESFYAADHNTTPKLLDYGGASGEILKFFTKDYKCGILDYERWELQEKVRYLGKDLSDLNETARFDIILLLHTLEHIINPIKFLKSLCDYLNDEGLIYIEVPLGCFKEWNFLSDPITHINFFSEQSLYRTCELSGLNIIHLGTSFQLVGGNKSWCLNLIGTKNKLDKGIRTKDILSAKNQMTRINYYIPFIFEPKRFIRLVKRVIYNK